MLLGTFHKQNYPQYNMQDYQELLLKITLEMKPRVAGSALGKALALHKVG